MLPADLVHILQRYVLKCYAMIGLHKIPSSDSDSDSDSDIIVLLCQETFIIFRFRVSHLHNYFHSFVFRSILLPYISLSRSPDHRSYSHTLLLRPLFFPYHPVHPMSSSIFSLAGYNNYTQEAHVSLFLLSHPHINHHHISIPFLWNLLLEDNLI